jgi:hypothetical protein
MIDNTEQYLLVHLVLVEYLNSKNTCFPCNKTLPEAIAQAKNNSSYQYQRFKKMFSLLSKYLNVFIK